MQHALDLAAALGCDRLDGPDDGWHLGPSDSALAARALRSFAGRHLRRGAVIALALGAIVAFELVGAEDRNGDGRLNWRDVAMAFSLPS